ncbi:MAG: hypothetical protein NTV01_15115 [Bacteroidia bacterium]|nr:hypothetical protein [Bacteroidia bacterium]
METTARENRSQTIFMQGLIAVAIVLSAVVEFDLEPFSLMNIALDLVVVLIIGLIVWVMVRKKMAEHAFKDGRPNQG